MRRNEFYLQCSGMQCYAGNHGQTSRGTGSATATASKELMMLEKIKK